MKKCWYVSEKFWYAGTISTGLGKNLVWVSMAKNPGGSKILAKGGGGDFWKFYFVPPKIYNMCCPSNAPPILRPSAANANNNNNYEVQS